MIKKCDLFGKKHITNHKPEKISHLGLIHLET